MTWTKPGLNGGPEITGYRLEYREPAENWIYTTTAPAGSDTWSIGGLTADTSYQARVQAENGETPSDWSEPSDAARTHPQGETLDSVDVTSTPLLMSSGALTPDTYGAGEEIRFTVTFSGAVDVTGNPIFQFYFSNNGGDLSEPPVDAPYESGSGSNSLVFTYTVVSTDRADDGLYLVGDTVIQRPVGPGEARWGRCDRGRRDRDPRQPHLCDRAVGRRRATRWTARGPGTGRPMRRRSPRWR